MERALAVAIPFVRDLLFAVHGDAVILSNGTWKRTPDWCPETNSEWKQSIYKPKSHSDTTGGYSVSMHGNLLVIGGKPIWFTRRLYNAGLPANEDWQASFNPAQAVLPATRQISYAYMEKLSSC